MQPPRRGTGTVQQLGYPEIGDLWSPLSKIQHPGPGRKESAIRYWNQSLRFRAKQDIGGLEVPMHDAALVNVVEGPGQKGDPFRCRPFRLRCPIQQLAQAAAI